MAAATLNGDVSDEGDFPVTEKGFYYGTSQDPASNGTQHQSGSGPGGYDADLYGLTASTTYYFMAYAISRAGTALGEVLSFTTDAEAVAPMVITNAATVIRNDEATLNGNVTDDGGTEVTERGFYYGIYSDPMTHGLKAEAGTGSGSFKRIQGQLSGSTTYYFVAYATNSAGTGYGEVQSFKSAYNILTGQSGILTDIDGNIYDWVGIGEQAWMAENLKTTRMADGTAIPYVADNTTWGTLGQEAMAYSWYEGDDTKRNLYGLLYTWTAATNGASSSDNNPSLIQGACPDGWHMPSDSEWNQMEMALGMTQTEADSRESRGTDEGGKLKVMGQDHWKSPNSGATNSSGFSALPGGNRDDGGGFRLETEFAYFWTTTEHSSYNAFIHRVDYWNSQIYRNPFHRSSGMSVRYVKD